MIFKEKKLLLDVLLGEIESEFIRISFASAKEMSTLDIYTDSVCLHRLENGNIICGSRDGIIREYNPKTKKFLNRLVAHKSSVCCVVELKGGEIMSGSGDQEFMEYINYEI